MAQIIEPEIYGAPDGVMVEPVEILVDLARRGEIDPWNIDIVTVTDKFLRRLEELSELDLRISGRTLFYASLLLRMKSDALVEEEPYEPEFLDGEYFFDPCFEFPVEVDDEMLLKPAVRRFYKRQVVLQDLIDELERAEKVEKQRVRREHTKADKHVITTEEALSVAHEEDMEMSIARLWGLLVERFNGNNFLVFSDLLSDNSPSSIIGVYLPLLFLADRKTIWLEQEEIFGDLYVRRRENG